MRFARGGNKGSLTCHAASAGFLFSFFILGCSPGYPNSARDVIELRLMPMIEVQGTAKNDRDHSYVGQLVAREISSCLQLFFVRYSTTTSVGF